MCKKIRFATREDTAAIKSLWEICFPEDGSGFNPWYFENIWEPKETLLLLDDNHLSAMVQALPYALTIADKLEDVTYIYGACTAPDFRRKGYMRELLEYSFQWDIENGRIASILIPQEEWLFDFYQQFGYQPYFSLKEYSSPSAPYLKPGNCLKPCTQLDIDTMMELYRKHTDNAVFRSACQWKQQLALFQALGLGAWGHYEGREMTAYCFIWQQGEEDIWLQEAIGSENAIKDMLGELSQRFPIIKNIKVTGALLGESKRFGCIRFHDKRQIEHSFYMNLMFN